MKGFEVSGIPVGNGAPLVLVGGPCVIETEAHLLSVGRRIKEIAVELGIPWVLKTSTDKANRTSVTSYRGVGMEAGLGILKRVKAELDVPVLTDVHTVEQVAPAAEVADILQVPAFLCRQTDLLVAVGRAGRVVNVKKGQFLAPHDTRGIIGKLETTGNPRIMLTERGSTFGYNNLVVDMRSLPIMRSFGYPVMFDATHSLQLPGGLDDATGGQREFVPHLARAAVAVGIDAIFIEIHDNPDEAPCDGPNMARLEDLPGLLRQIRDIDRLVKEKQWMS